MKRRLKAKNSKFYGILILFILLAAIPLTLFLTQQEQDIRQRAAACTTGSGKTLTVYVYDDLNGNGKPDTGEPPISGADVKITGGTASLTPQQTIGRNPQIFIGKVAESAMQQTSELLVRPVYAACSGNKDCKGGQPYCVGKSCVECRNPGSKNDCGGNKVCNNNHKCVAPTPTPVPSTGKTVTPGPACTRELKICADGTKVGRTGPNCEFEACPGTSPTSTTTQQTTGSDGKTTFTGLCGTTYSVQVYAPSAYKPVAPKTITLSASTTTMNAALVKNGPGQNPPGGSTPPAACTGADAHTLTIHVFDDLDGDGSLDNDEPPISGADVKISGGTASLTPQKTIGRNPQIFIGKVAESAMQQTSELLVRPVYAACSGNKDCKGGQPYCVGKSCVECRNPGSKNDCGGNKVCNNNHKCVAPTPTPVPSTGETVTPAQVQTTQTTGENGTVAFTNLCGSAYTITITSPDGYDAADSITVDMSKGSAVTKNVGLTKTDSDPDEPSITPFDPGSFCTLAGLFGFTCPTSPSPAVSPSEPVPSGTTPPTAAPSGGTPSSIPTGPTTSITGKPTGPLPSGATGLNLSLLLNGIGAAGDNVVKEPPACQRSHGKLDNPNSCLSNQNPLNPEREVFVELFTTDTTQTNTPAASADGLVTYDEATGKFTGQINLGMNWKTGTYIIKVSTPMYLRRQITGIHKVTAGQSYTAPEENLTSSDVDGDNKLTILDYNLIISCYTFPGMVSPCSTEDAADVDVNDDGKNDEFDENLFLRDFSVQNGD